MILLKDFLFEKMKKGLLKKFDLFENFEFLVNYLNFLIFDDVNYWGYFR